MVAYWAPGAGRHPDLADTRRCQAASGVDTLERGLMARSYLGGRLIALSLEKQSQSPELTRVTTSLSHAAALSLRA
jgi:hypothetical protein